MRKPFSLLELVAVVGILSLMMMVSFPMFLSQDDNSMETITRRINTLFEAARTAAMMDGTPKKVTINFRDKTISGGTKKDEDGAAAAAAAGSSGSLSTSSYRPTGVRDLNNNRVSSDPEGRKNMIMLRKMMVADVPDVTLPDNYTIELDYQNDHAFHPYAENFVSQGEQESISFEFRADGLGTMPRFRISDGTEIRTIEILPLTGRIHMETVR